MFFLLKLYDNKPLQYSILVYILSLIIVNMLKPEIMFNNDNKKEFGIGKNKTLFPFVIQCLIGSVFLYLLLNIYY